MANTKTEGDLLFESFLRSQGGYDFTFEPDLASELGVKIATSPDYLVRWDSGLAVCEVKQFETTALEDRLWRQGTITASDNETYGPVRGALRAGARQLKPLSGRDVPLVIVLTNPLRMWVDLRPEMVQGAMLGNIGIRVGIIPGEGPAEPPDLPPETVAARDGVMLRERRHIGAVLVVHSAERADVYETGDENAAPLPDGVFDDGRGERYGYLSDGRYGPLNTHVG
jgi:hypothetical protein